MTKQSKIQLSDGDDDKGNIINVNLYSHPLLSPHRHPMRQTQLLCGKGN